MTKIKLRYVMSFGICKKQQFPQLLKTSTIQTQ